MCDSRKRRKMEKMEGKRKGMKIKKERNKEKKRRKGMKVKNGRKDNVERN